MRLPPIPINPENEIARFRALKPQYLAISIPPARQKQILRQWASRCSRTTRYENEFYEIVFPPTAVRIV